MQEQPKLHSARLKTELIKKEKARVDKARLAQERLKQSINAVAATEDGRVLLRHLANVCGFGKYKIVADSQARTVDAVSTACNAMMENVYLNVRKFIRREHLIKIELNKIEES